MSDDFDQQWPWEKCLQYEMDLDILRELIWACPNYTEAERKESLDRLNERKKRFLETQYGIKSTPVV